MRYSTYNGEVDIDYILRKASVPSDVLVVSFPGAGGDRFKATALGLGYMMTIGQFNVNALYIKNTDGKHSNTAFIGTKGDLSIERSVVGLIKYACSETGAQRCIAVGSSMGGNSALYYGLRYNWDIIAGGARASAGLWTGRLIRQIIPTAKEGGFNKSIYMCWGKGEPMWVDPTQAPSLLSLFDEAGIPYEKELFDYSAHVSISRVFPAILNRKIGALVGGGDSPDVRSIEPGAIEIAAKINTSIKTLIDYIGGLDQLAPNMAIQCRFHRKPYGIKKLSAFALDRLKKKIRKISRRRVTQTFKPRLSRSASMLTTRGNGRGGKWRGEVRVAESVIDRMCAAHGKRRNHPPYGPAWMDAKNKIISAIKAVLGADEALTKMDDSYARMQFLLLAAEFYKGHERFYRETYERAVQALNAVTDYYFDKNGVCIFEQVDAQHGVLDRLGNIVRFIEANGFGANQGINRLKRRLVEIQAVAAGLTRPDGITPNLGHSSHKKAAIAPLKGSLVKSESNIAVFADDRAYITIGGGSNIHSAYRHCDLLSFTFWYDGQQLVCDAGGGKDELSDYAHSSVAHSALLCDERDYITPGYMDWTTLDDPFENDQYALITAKHRLIEGVTLSRTWLWLKPNVIVLFDEGTSGEEHVYTQNFLLRCNHNGRLIEREKSGINRGMHGDSDLSVASRHVSLRMAQFDGGFEVIQNMGTRRKTSDIRELRGSLIDDFTKPRGGLNLVYSKRAKTARFLTVIEARGGIPGEAKVRDARLYGGCVALALTDGRGIEVPLKPRFGRDKEDDN